MFGSTTTISVASSVYNLAGDVTKRPNYKKSLVVGNVISNNGFSTGEVFESGYLRGPGINLRNFARWARSQGYEDSLGFVTGELTLNSSIDLIVIQNCLPHDPVTEKVNVQNAYIGNADYSRWAEQYMLLNHPSEVTDEWKSDFNEETNIISIVFPDNTVEVFSPVDYDLTGRYLYVYYNVIKNEVIGPLVVGSTVEVTPPNPLPSTVGWNNITLESEEKEEELTKTIETIVRYSDGRPEEESTTTTTSTVEFIDFTGSWERRTDTGPNKYKQETMHQQQKGVKKTRVVEEETEEEIEDGVIKTTVTTTTTEYIEYARSYRIDYRDNTTNSYKDLQLFIYKKGTGNPSYDVMFGAQLPVGSFFPFVPLRIRNRFISEDYFGDIYPLAKKAIRKSTTGQLDKLLTSIGENDSIGDIDYAYAVYGVSLNVIDKSAKRYIYEFFRQIMLGTINYGNHFETWKTQWEIADASWTAWVEWERDRNSSGNDGARMFGWGDEPVRIPYPVLPEYSVKMASSNRHVLNYDMTIKWNSINETTNPGEMRPGAKLGDIDVSKGEITEHWGWVYYQGSGGDGDTEGSGWAYVKIHTIKQVSLSYQNEKSSWKKVDVWGLEHVNMIYGGKGVIIDGHKALDDPDESGFIIPLHEEIYRTIPLTDSTQMATACCMLVFNCYEVRKSKWYQSGFFQILVVIAVIVIAVYFAPAGMAGGAGMLGSNAALGASIGLTGTAAIIAGAAVNAIAAMVVTQMVMAVAKAAFGEKLGSIIGAIASFIVVAGITASQAGASISENLSTLFPNMMKAENLMKLTLSVGNGVAEYIQSSAQDILAETQSLMEEYRIESGAIQKLYEENIGFGLGTINPISLTDIGKIPFESPDSFLSRTLMTGSDIAEMSLKMIEDFTNITLEPSTIT